MIHVGTSSWADPGFVEEWYPEGLAPRDRLPYYAERFDAVEVNSTFYAVPQERQVARWADVTPDGFTFDVKLHRPLSRHSAPLDSLPAPLRERARTGPRELAGKAEQVRLHFNNNRGSDAPVAAERMRELLGQAVSA